MRSSRSWKPRIAVAAALLAALAGGCMTGPRPAAPAADRPQSSASPMHASLLPLSRAAAREQRVPSLEAMRLPPPPEVDASLAAVIEDDGRSRVSLEDAVRHFADLELKDELPAARPATAVSRQDSSAALRRYLAARQRLFDDDLAGAIDELRHATRLDPEAPEPWRELGEAYMAQSSRAEAVAAFRAAIARGLHDPRLLELLGRDAIERNEHLHAAQYFSRAALAHPEASDPLLPHVIDVGLAGALAGEGYIVAARDAVRRALQRQTPVAAPTRYLQEYGAIFRRQGDLWREVGDAECRLGRYEEALDAYRRAAGLPTINEEAVLGRTVYAAMRAGRPAAAAITILQEIIASGGLAGEMEIALLRHIAGIAPDGATVWKSPVRLETAAALATIRGSLGDGLTPTVARAMVRAESAVLGAAAARPLLRELLIQGAPDAAIAADLINLAPTSAEAVREAALVVTAAPAAADEMAEALLRSRFDLDEVLEQLSRSPAPPTRPLLAAHIHARAGRYALAADLAETISREGPIADVAALAWFEFGIAAGRDREVGDPSAASTSSPPAARMTARRFLLAQRHERALQVLVPVLENVQGNVSRQDRLETLLMAAGVASASGRIDDAERWLREALALDPHDERPYSQLLSLYAPGSPRSDSTRSAQVLRDLRTNTSDSRTARLLMTREMLRRGLLPQAEAAALDLADESLDLAAVELLAAAWQLQSSRGDVATLERGLAWVDSMRIRRPHATPLLAAATTLLSGARRADEAEQLLRGSVDAGAGRDAARLLERVIRDQGRGTIADGMALARLQDRTLLPADSLELAEACANLGRDADVTRALLQVLDPAVTLIGDQPQRAIALIDQIAERLLAGGSLAQIDPERHGQIIELFDRAASREIPFGTEIHERRLRLVAAEPRSSLEDIRGVAAHAASQHPSLRWRPYALAAHVAGAMGRGEIGLELIRQMVEQSPRPDVELLGEWFFFVVMAGDASTGRGMIEALHAQGRLVEVLTRLQVQLEAGADPRAEAAFVLANEFAAAGREADSVAAYELTLEYDPRHAWACNNLGYMLLEQGGDLARADELLTRAIEILPEQAAVIDSLGWLRYVQGNIEDLTDPGNAVIREGAVTLLARAARTREGRTNPTILDHYGDALYRAGRADQAVQAWRTAYSQARQQLGQAEVAAQRPDADSPPPVRRNLQVYREISRSTQDKMRAHRDGRPVPVAPFAGEAARDGRAPAGEIPGSPSAAPQPEMDRGRTQ
jgi:tetratricopeptide (TPR) repeat protein